jgi:DNA (cytosine-5)-methyltransferase 1
MEAASVAWHPLGWTPVGFSEIEPFPCAILKHRFPNIPNYGSLTEYQSWPLQPGSIDLLVGGTPCQSFSVAGLRKGLADPRGNLALTFLGLADKLKPRWIVWENVPGVLSSGGGRDFGSFLGALVELGYGFAYRVLDAQHFGVPQRRRRVFVVACLGDWRAAAEVLSLAEGLSGYLAQGNKKRKGAAGDASGGVDADGLQRTVGTLCADTHPGAYSGQDAYTGRLIPQQKPVVIDRAAFNQGENAQYEPHIEESEVMDSLIARGPHAVGVPPHIVQASELRIRGRITEQNTCPTLLANTKSGDNDPLAVHAISFQPGNLRRKACADPSTESFPTLTKDSGDQSPHVATIHPTVTTCTGVRQGCSAEAMSSLSAMSNAGAFPNMVVRRLTPVECERLQGFPDNWSRISWKGKPEEECPDGPRYKACGNSMAVPVMAFIGRQIAAVDSTLPPHA